MTNKRQSASSQPGEGSDMDATAVKLDHDCVMHPSAGKLLLMDIRLFNVYGNVS